MHKYRLIAVALAALCAASAFAQDSLINHPVMCYKQIRRCASCPAYDSVLVGKITYDPMPGYQLILTIIAAMDIAEQAKDHDNLPNVAVLCPKYARKLHCGHETPLREILKILQEYEFGGVSLRLMFRL